MVAAVWIVLQYAQQPSSSQVAFIVPLAPVVLQRLLAVAWGQTAEGNRRTGNISMDADDKPKPLTD